MPPGREEEVKKEYMGVMGIKREPYAEKRNNLSK